MRRRRPGERLSADALHVRATLGAIAASVLVIGIGLLLAPSHRASLIAAGAVVIALHVITLVSIALGSRFPSISTAVSVGSYLVKLVALIAILAALKGSGAVNIEVVVGALIFAIAASLAVTTLTLAKGPGPVIGQD